MLSCNRPSRRLRFTTSRAQPIYYNRRFTTNSVLGWTRVLLVVSASLMILASLFFLPAVLI